MEVRVNVNVQVKVHVKLTFVNEACVSDYHTHPSFAMFGVAKGDTHGMSNVGNEACVSDPQTHASLPKFVN